MRFFSATAMAGRLHLLDISDFGPWDSSRIVFHDEQEVDLILTRMMIRKVQTIEELDDALKASENTPGSASFHVHESLLDAAKQRWEEMHDRLLQDTLEH